MATKTESVGSAPRGAVDGLVKGMPNDLATVPIDTIAQMGWNLLTGDVSLPSAVLHAAAIEHNIRWMQHYVGTLGAHLRGEPVTLGVVSTAREKLPNSDHRTNRTFAPRVVYFPGGSLYIFLVSDSSHAAMRDRLPRFVG